jgi:hypothetical protein
LGEEISRVRSNAALPMVVVIFLYLKMSVKDCSNTSQEIDCLTSLIRLPDSNKEPQTTLENIKTATNRLILYDITEVKDLLKHIILSIVQTLKEIYTSNNLIVQSEENEILDVIKNNFQV